MIQPKLEMLCYRAGSGRFMQLAGFGVFHKSDSFLLIRCHIHPLLRNQFFNKRDLQCSENFLSPL